MVKATIEHVARTIGEGVALVLVILFLFLGSWRVALIVAVAIPLALAAVFIVMTLFHMPANLFSLGAIDFGVIVDGAIVVTEAHNIIGDGRAERLDAAFDSHAVNELAAAAGMSDPIDRQTHVTALRRALEQARSA